MDTSAMRVQAVDFYQSFKLRIEHDNKIHKTTYDQTILLSMLNHDRKDIAGPTELLEGTEGVVNKLQFIIDFHLGNGMKQIAMNLSYFCKEQGSLLEKIAFEIKSSLLVLMLSLKSVLFGVQMLNAEKNDFAMKTKKLANMVKSLSKLKTEENEFNEKNFEAYQENDLYFKEKEQVRQAFNRNNVFNNITNEFTTIGEDDDVSDPSSSRRRLLEGDGSAAPDAASEARMALEKHELKMKKQELNLMLAASGDADAGGGDNDMSGLDVAEQGAVVEKKMAKMNIIKLEKHIRGLQRNLAQMKEDNQSEAERVQSEAERIRKRMEEAEAERILVKRIHYALKIQRKFRYAQLFKRIRSRLKLKMIRRIMVVFRMYYKRVVAIRKERMFRGLIKAKNVIVRFLRNRQEYRRRRYVAAVKITEKMKRYHMRQLIYRTAREVRQIVTKRMLLMSQMLGDQFANRIKRLEFIVEAVTPFVAAQSIEALGSTTDLSQHADEPLSKHSLNHQLRDLRQFTSKTRKRLGILEKEDIPTVQLALHTAVRMKDLVDKMPSKPSALPSNKSNGRLSSSSTRSSREAVERKSALSVSHDTSHDLDVDSLLKKVKKLGKTTGDFYKVSVNNDQKEFRHVPITETLLHSLRGSGNGVHPVVVDATTSFADGDGNANEVQEVEEPLFKAYEAVKSKRSVSLSANMAIRSDGIVTDKLARIKTVDCISELTDAVVLAKEAASAGVPLSTSVDVVSQSDNPAYDQPVVSSDSTAVDVVLSPSVGGIFSKHSDHDVQDVGDQLLRIHRKHTKTVPHSDGSSLGEDCIMGTACSVPDLVTISHCMILNVLPKVLESCQWLCSTYVPASVLNPQPHRSALEAQGFYSELPRMSLFLSPLMLLSSAVDSAFEHSPMSATNTGDVKWNITPSYFDSDQYLIFSALYKGVPVVDRQLPYTWEHNHLKNSYGGKGILPSRPGSALSYWMHRPSMGSNLTLLGLVNDSSFKVMDVIYYSMCETTSALTEELPNIAVDKVIKTFVDQLQSIQQSSGEAYHRGEAAMSLDASNDIAVIAMLGDILTLQTADVNNKSWLPFASNKLNRSTGVSQLLCVVYLVQVISTIFQLHERRKLNKHSHVCDTAGGEVEEEFVAEPEEKPASQIETDKSLHSSESSAEDLPLHISLDVALSTLQYLCLGLPAISVWQTSNDVYYRYFQRSSADGKKNISSVRGSRTKEKSSTAPFPPVMQMLVGSVLELADLSEPKELVLESAEDRTKRETTAATQDYLASLVQPPSDPQSSNNRSGLTSARKLRIAQNVQSMNTEVPLAPGEVVTPSYKANKKSGYDFNSDRTLDWLEQHGGPNDDIEVSNANAWSLRRQKRERKENECRTKVTVADVETVRLIAISKAEAAEEEGRLILSVGGCHHSTGCHMLCDCDVEKRKELVAEDETDENDKNTPTIASTVEITADTAPARVPDNAPAIPKQFTLDGDHCHISLYSFIQILLPYHQHQCHYMRDSLWWNRSFRLAAAAQMYEMSDKCSHSVYRGSIATGVSQGRDSDPQAFPIWISKHQFVAFVDTFTEKVTDSSHGMARIAYCEQVYDTHILDHGQVQMGFNAFVAAFTAVLEWTFELPSGKKISTVVNEVLMANVM